MAEDGADDALMLRGESSVRGWPSLATIGRCAEVVIDDLLSSSIMKNRTEEAAMLDKYRATIIVPSNDTSGIAVLFRPLDYVCNKSCSRTN